ncbi:MULTISPECIES: NADH-dependent flavin oxidoreductase [unclassified Staphylococcus]|uniref:NADH-dependent flavin oxidoreductase n=1 Tax=unclassified Staphylococcus TaxID=91994 RepID=UPI0021D2124A|nr:MULTISPECIES: NADH-dependent flavin oxidoreductase [unclassified Staphylococcus]UXR78976.1 NADH-dependent flavin oxidoreductase [Staphylococcus sp. IVB6227]UXR83136.1 NADH-dependent flavin oxidoreductase [Staphylococcus sp. IVB6214]
MNEKFAPLFQPLTFPNGKTIENRFVLAPLTHTISNEDGTVSDREVAYMSSRTKGVGLAITAASYTNVEGKAFPGQPSISKDADIEGLRRVAETIKENGATAIVQIHHGGVKSLPNLVPNGDVKGPSEVETSGWGEKTPHSAREMTGEEIYQAIEDFGRATSLAIKAGFDGVEIHGANHYLIHQFFSPYYNRRHDMWGEPLRFPVAVVDEVLRVAEEEGPENFIVGYRFSPEEAETPGITMSRTKCLVDTLIEKSLDYLHVSLGDIQSRTREGEYAGEKRISLLLDWIDGRMPLIGVGSIFNARDVMAAQETGTPLLALGRGLLFDPEFVQKIEAGRESEIIDYFDAEREDKHSLPDELWESFATEHYASPKKNER